MTPRLHPQLSMLVHRFREQPAWAVVLELFVGLGWLRAAAAKIIDPSWWTGTYLDDFLVEHADETLPWFTPFLTEVVGPLSPVVSFVVLAAQLAVGTLLLLGRHRLLALAAAITMNLAFVAAGAVTPSAFYLVIQLGLLFWLLERSERPVPSAGVVATGGLALVGFNLPFIATLHPDGVIEDPALMMMTVGGLAAAGALSVSMSRRPERATERVPVSVR